MSLSPTWDLCVGPTWTQYVCMLIPDRRTAGSPRTPWGWYRGSHISTSKEVRPEGGWGRSPRARQQPSRPVAVRGFGKPPSGWTRQRPSASPRCGGLVSPVDVFHPFSRGIVRRGRLSVDRPISPITGDLAGKFLTATLWVVLLLKTGGNGPCDPTSCSSSTDYLDVACEQYT